MSRRRKITSVCEKMNFEDGAPRRDMIGSCSNDEHADIGLFYRLALDNASPSAKSLSR